MTTTADRIDHQLAVDTIRTLSIDGVQQANSGHPGAPMGAAPMAYVLWTRFLRTRPRDPALVRPRPVRAVGGPRQHAAVLAAPPDGLRPVARRAEALPPVRARITPGHPEYGLTPGVEATTGPLGQGFTNAVGMAIAERRLAAEFNRPGHAIIDHWTYGICSRRGPAGGHRRRRRPASPVTCKLGKLVFLYDDNGIQLDGPTKHGLVGGCARPLRRLRLAHPARRGRQRPRRHRGRPHRGPCGRPAEPHRGQDGHRLRLAQPCRLPEGTRCAARPRRGAPHQGGLRLGSRQDARLDVHALTLHVGPGTFSPVRANRIDNHQMHRERYSIPESTFEAVRSGRPVVAVGTTVVRALESAERPGPGETALFITPGHRFRTVNLLVTNFHLPRSTLLMLVCAFAGRELVLAGYRHAVGAGYRFYSYGDAMLVERAR